MIAVLAACSDEDNSEKEETDELDKAKTKEP